jgi:drug/metabolite transporter (DMT)-like permease
MGRNSGATLRCIRFDVRGFVFWNAGLARSGIARVGQAQLLQTFITIALSALILSEPVRPAMIGFALAVAAVVWLGHRARAV